LYDIFTMSVASIIKIFDRPRVKESVYYGQGIINVNCIFSNNDINNIINKFIESDDFDLILINCVQFFKLCAIFKITKGVFGRIL
jgi:hypothetical protein